MALQVRLYTTGPRSDHVELTVISDPKVFHKTFVSHCTDQARGVGGSLAMDILSSVIPAGQAGVCVESNDVADSCHAAPPGSEKVSGAGWFPMVSSASVQGIPSSLEHLYKQRARPALADGLKLKRHSGALK